MCAWLGSGVTRRGVCVRGTFAIMLMTSLLMTVNLKAQQPPPDDRVPPRSAGGAPGGEGTMAAQAPALGEGPTCTFDATVYDLRLPVGRIGRLDVEALGKSAVSADAFEKALTGLGVAKPMYRVRQSVRLAGDLLTIGTKFPLITNSSRTALGQTVSSYRFENLGAQFSIGGEAGGPGSHELDLSIQVTAISDAGVTSDESAKRPVIRSVTLLHRGAFEPRKPFIVMSVDADAVDKNGNAVAYIARITLGEPESTGKK